MTAMQGTFITSHRKRNDEGDEWIADQLITEYQHTSRGLEYTITSEGFIVETGVIAGQPIEARNKLQNYHNSFCSSTGWLESNQPSPKNPS